MTRASLNTDLYHAIQVVYRRSVVEHVRAAFNVAYGKDGAKEFRRLFGSKWDELVAKSSESRAAGVVRTPPVDDYDRLDVSYVSNILDAKQAILLPKIPEESEAEWKARKNRTIKQAQLVGSARNPNSHPTSTDVTVEDFVYAVENARRVVMNFDFAAESSLGEAIREVAAPTRNPEAFLPPSDEIGGKFVGRASELAALWAWLRDRDSARWMLMGPGGRGKTAIAYEFARQVREAGAPGVDLIVWMTAKRRAFVEGQVQEKEPNFVDLESAIRYLLSVTGMLSRGQDISLDEGRRLTREVLTQFPTLIVVDDVDSLEGSQDDAIEFFSGLAFRSNSKLLMTSRRPLLGLGLFSTVVEGLSKPDANEFIDARLAFYRIDPESITRKRRERILEVTESSPLYLEDLLRLLASGVNPEQILASWARRRGEAARLYALGRELELLGPIGREVLVAAAIPGHSVSADELRRATGRSGEDVESAVGELHRLFLIPKARLVDGAERVALEANTRGLVLEWAAKELPTGTEKIAANWQAIARNSRKTGARSPETVSLIRRSAALASDGRSADAERGLLAAITQRPEDAALHSQLGSIYARWSPPRITDARHELQRATDLGYSDPAMYRDWVNMEAKAGEFALAVRAGVAGLSRHAYDNDLRLRTGDAQWQFARTRRDAVSALSGLSAAIDTLRPLLAEKPDVPVEPAVRERAFALTAYALAARISSLDAFENARTAYGRDPADIISQREGVGDRESGSKLERIRLRQILTRWAREVPGDQQRKVSAQLRPLSVDARQAPQRARRPKN